MKNYESVEGTAKSAIFIYLPGGCAHQETWDPKPYAPVENRGPFGSIPTVLPGIRVNELMPQTAKLVDRLAICRSLAHGENDHDRGIHVMFTGYKPTPVVNYPSFGSIVAHHYGSRNSLPPFINVPDQVDNASGPGFLSAAYNGYSLGSDPAGENFKVQDLQLPDDITPERFATRRRMLDAVNDHFRKTEESDAIDAVDSFYQRAYDIINSRKARAAFDLSNESDKLRDEYGRNEAGARFLLARRLVEAGVRFITVNYGSWDHHSNIEPGIRKHVPTFDQAFATLIRDLDDRGLLDSTLVVASSEFGRTPTINTSAGRDHWG
ncbi:MAG: DUF1501 domain-containing protein, partial [Planctomycetales bacterium]